MDDCARAHHGGRSARNSRWRRTPGALSAKRDPLGAARALLELFRSVVDYGGYLIKDFTPHQFTLHGKQVVPRRRPDVALDGADGLVPPGPPGLAPVRQSTRGWRETEAAACSNALPSFPMQKACRATCPAMRTRFSSGPACCCPYPGTCGSPAARDLCHLDQTRATIQNRPHATDAATAWWALPLILAEARGAAQTAGRRGARAAAGPQGPEGDVRVRAERVGGVAATAPAEAARVEAAAGGRADGQNDQRHGPGGAVLGH